MCPPPWRPHDAAGYSANLPQPRDLIAAAYGGRHTVLPTLNPNREQQPRGAGMEFERRAADSASARYRPRRPRRSVLFRCGQEHLETWPAQCRDSHDDERSVPEHIERDFRRYLECGILAHGLARARCGQCGHDFLIAFSCKGRGMCPSCITRRVVATTAHLTDHGSAPVPPRHLHRHRYLGTRAYDRLLEIFAATSTGGLWPD